MVAISFQQWLDSGQDFAQGLALLEAHPGARPALVAMLRRNGAGRLTTPQLSAEVARLAATCTPVEAPRPSKGPSKPDADQPAEVADLVAERIALFKEAADLHSKLTLLPSDAARFAAASTIKRNFRRIDEIWDALNYREQHGTLPPVVAPPVLDTADRAAWLKRRNTLRTYLSSQRGTVEKRQAWAAEVAQLERSLNG